MWVKSMRFRPFIAQKDTPRSNFIVALEHFWNEWGCTQTDLVFIVCGSATSWITKKILRNHGGLHNRATHRLYLHPFTLGETRDYLASRGLELSIKDVVECYEEKAQIDLIINRADRVMNVCEMKYSMDEYAFSKKEAEHLQRRVSLFRQQCQVRSAIHPVLVTTYGLRQNAYSSVVQNVVTMDQLFD